MRFFLLSSLCLLLFCWRGAQSAAFDGKLTSQVLADEFKYPAATSTVIDLSGKSISSITDGTFTAYKTVLELQLGANSLSELKPGVFTGMDALAKLLLANTGLGQIQAGVLTPPTLELVDLTASKVATLAEGAFKDLPKLAKLALSGNMLQALSAKAFSATPALKELYLDNNLILSQLNLDELTAALPSLAYLSLFNNQLPASVIESFKGKMLNLVTLDMGKNAINALKANLLDSFPKLKTFKAAKNGLTLLPANTFSAQTVIETIDLADNKIKTMEDKAFSGLDKLTFLRLSSNELESLKPGVLVNLNLLDTLEMSKNKLKEWPKDALAQLKALRVLDLSNNQLTSLVDPATFTGNPALTSLYLQGNSISKIDVNLFNLEKPCFTYLDMSSNPISAYATVYQNSTTKCLRVKCLPKNLEGTGLCVAGNSAAKLSFGLSSLFAIVVAIALSRQ